MHCLKRLFILFPASISHGHETDGTSALFSPSVQLVSRQIPALSCHFSPVNALGIEGIVRECGRTLYTADVGSTDPLSQFLAVYLKAKQADAFSRRSAVTIPGSLSQSRTGIFFLTTAIKVHATAHRHLKLPTPSDHTVLNTPLTSSP